MIDIDVKCTRKGKESFTSKILYVTNTIPQRFLVFDPFEGKFDYYNLDECTYCGEDINKTVLQELNRKIEDNQRDILDNIESIEEIVKELESLKKLINQEFKTFRQQTEDAKRRPKKSKAKGDI